MGLNTLPKNGGFQDPFWGSWDPFWEVLRPILGSPQIGVQTRKEGSQHLELTQHVSLNMLIFARKNEQNKSTGLAYRTPTPQHHVASVHVSLNSLMCDVALSSTRLDDDRVDPQDKNTMNSWQLNCS